MTKSISASVGKNGANKSNDVKIIQELLNGVSNIHGGPLSPLTIDGLCWGLTLKAIEIFQKTACGFQWPDQLIEPAGKTWNQLIALAEDIIGDVEIVGPPYWGVDSVAPAHKRFGGEPTLYDFVTIHSNGRPPAFFGRYLTLNDKQRITFDEVLFLASKKCKILLCYNQMSIAEVRKDYKNGLFHANRAADRANALPVRQSKFSPLVWIYANIDSGYQPTKYWLAGWWDGLWDRGYGPGIYYTAHVDSTLIQQSFEKCKKIPAPASLWLSAWSNCSSSKACKDGNILRIPPQFTPDQPQTPGVVDVWQYAGPCFNNAFDMNLSNQRGYDRMWNVSSSVGFYPAL